MKRLLGATDAPRMPMGGQPLKDFDINLVRAWIDHGTFPSVAASAGKADASPPAASRNDRVEGVSQGTADSSAAGSSRNSSPAFATEIRPILAARCYQCHGPDIQQNGLRLDSLQALLEGSETGKIIVPGSSEKSRLVRRLLALDRPQMPYGGPPLPRARSTRSASGLTQGAPGPDSSAPLAHTAPVKHWAYMQPVRPPLPKVKDAAWCRNPIDSFVLARLEKEGLSPSPEASKETLIRRVSLDLIGLPPTMAEVDAFLADHSPNAYEKVGGPAAGVAALRRALGGGRGLTWRAMPTPTAMKRTCDANVEIPRLGHQRAQRGHAFQEFTIEQIAGDMLPNPTEDQLIATGFNRNTHAESARAESIPKSITGTRKWTGSTPRPRFGSGITLGCAECHNHKFDPFTQKDYYRFLAFFDNTDYKVLHLGQGENEEEEPKLELPTPEQEVKSKKLRAQIADLETKLDTSTPELEAAQSQWEANLKAAEAEWNVLRASHAVSAGGATLKALPDGSIFGIGQKSAGRHLRVDSDTDRTGITGVRIEVLPDASLPNGGPGRDPDGNFFLSAPAICSPPLAGRLHDTLSTSPPSSTRSTHSSLLIRHTHTRPTKNRHRRRRRRPINPPPPCYYC